MWMFPVCSLPQIPGQAAFLLSFRRLPMGVFWAPFSWKRKLFHFPFPFCLF